MSKTGIELPIIEDTGIDKEQVKVQLDYHKETKKMNHELQEKKLDRLFSVNFLVFMVVVLVIISGFAFMAVDSVTKSDIIDYWKLIIPVIMTYIGYAIGKGKQVNG